jgi:hypothetical protein
MSEAFRSWAQNKKTVTAKPASIFRRIVEIIKTLSRFGKSDPRVEQIFREIDEGKRTGVVKMRTPDMGGVDFSARDVNVPFSGGIDVQQEREGLGPERAGDGRGRNRGRGYAPLAGVATVKGATGPDPGLVDVAESYALAAGIPHRRQAEYVEVDPERAARIADAYAEMKHDPQNPEVKEAYADLIRQTKDQYQALVDAGYKFTFFDSATDPYEGNPYGAMRDLRSKKQMAVYGTYDGYGTEGITGAAIEDNPMLEPTGLRWPDQKGFMRPVTANDLFRAVHDAFGHGLEGAGFRARGEENAWQAHVRLFTGPAVKAITSETRGQNSWLNFGPYGEKNRTAKLEDTVFAEQKTGIMPEWTWTEGLAPDEVMESKSVGYNDPDPGEATAVERGIQGKSFDNALRWVAENAPTEDYKEIARGVERTMLALKGKGYKFSIKVAHIGDSVPSTLIGSRGIAKVNVNTGNTEVWLNGADVTGSVGVSYETALHEMIHAVTMASLWAGNLKSMDGTKVQKFTTDLYAVSNAVRAEFNKRVREVGVDGLSDFEAKVYNRLNNAINTVDEILAWGLTNREMQRWLDTIPYNNKTLWASLVDAIRRLLGISSDRQTALSEIISIGDNLLSPDIVSDLPQIPAPASPQRGGAAAATSARIDIPAEFQNGRGGIDFSRRNLELHTMFTDNVLPEDVSGRPFPDKSGTYVEYQIRPKGKVKELGQLYGSVPESDPTTFYVEWASFDPDDMTMAETIGLINLLGKDFPNIRTITGKRISGARYENRSERAKAALKRMSAAEKALSIELMARTDASTDAAEKAFRKRFLVLHLAHPELVINAARRDLPDLFNEDTQASREYYLAKALAEQVSKLSTEQTINVGRMRDRGMLDFSRRQKSVIATVEKTKAEKKSMAQRIADLNSEIQSKPHLFEAIINVYGDQVMIPREITRGAPEIRRILPYLSTEEIGTTNAVGARGLIQMFNSVPSKEEMAAVAISGRAKRGWYENSARALISVFGREDAPRFSALLAALSPQTSVQDNAINALNVWVNWDKAGRPTDRATIMRIMGQSVQGTKGEGSVLGAWKSNSVTALQALDPHSIIISGNKVNSFMKNLNDVVNAVTNDAWMANYADVDQDRFKGASYHGYSAKVRQAAEVATELTGYVWTPREIQETVWSWAKTTYELRKKFREMQVEVRPLEICCALAG